MITCLMVWMPAAAVELPALPLVAVVGEPDGRPDAVHAASRPAASRLALAAVRDRVRIRRRIGRP